MYRILEIEKKKKAERIKRRMKKKNEERDWFNHTLSTGVQQCSLWTLLMRRVAWPPLFSAFLSIPSPHQIIFREIFRGRLQITSSSSVSFNPRHLQPPFRELVCTTAVFDVRQLFKSSEMTPHLDLLYSFVFRSVRETFVLPFPRNRGDKGAKTPRKE